MTRRILALVVAALLVGAVGSTGCGSSSKATVPTELGPALGDDTLDPSGGGGKQKGKQKAKPVKSESANDG
jgi:hypothetical protein